MYKLLLFVKTMPIESSLLNGTLLNINARLDLSLTINMRYFKTLLFGGV